MDRTGRRLRYSICGRSLQAHVGYCGGTPTFAMSPLDGPAQPWPKPTRPPKGGKKK